MMLAHPEDNPEREKRKWMNPGILRAESEQRTEIDTGFTPAQLLRELMTDPMPNE
jgi:hypothetical protein